jgi:hypothetical protein
MISTLSEPVWSRFKRQIIWRFQTKELPNFFYNMGLNLWIVNNYYLTNTNSYK